jgi:hemolysin III
VEQANRNRKSRALDRTEVMADALVHLVGIIVAVTAGTTLLAYTAFDARAGQIPELAVYVASLIGVLSLSLAYNLWPATAFKRHLARLDQAAIFLFIAGSYTPFIALLDQSTRTRVLMIGVWSLSLLGVALKLFLPARFGRAAILLYLAIGWSGLLVFQQLAATFSPTTLWLLLAGGTAYSFGIVFHLWEDLRFQNALWHLAVVAGAMFHLGAAYDSVLFSRI